MNKPNETGGGRRRSTMAFRVSKSQREKIEKLAAQCGMNRSEYLLSRAYGYSWRMKRARCIRIKPTLRTASTPYGFIMNPTAASRIFTPQCAGRTATARPTTTTTYTSARRMRLRLWLFGVAG